MIKELEVRKIEAKIKLTELQLSLEQEKVQRVMEMYRTRSQVVNCLPVLNLLNESQTWTKKKPLLHLAKHRMQPTSHP